MKLTFESSPREKKKKKEVKFSNIVLLVLAIFLLLFIAGMIVIFCVYQSVPDTLIACVFAAGTGELSVLGWIKNMKTKYQNQEEDE